MSDKYHSSKEVNGFDSLKVDVSKLYERFPIEDKVNPQVGLVPMTLSRYHKLYRCKLIPLKKRVKLYNFFKRTNCDINWFIEFRNYWISCLGGRSLFGVSDFYGVRNIYRQNFQNNQVPSHANIQEHLEAWQQPELIHNLLHYQYREAFEQDAWILEQILKHHKNFKTMMEFGCSLASVTMKMIEFVNPSNVEFYISDIKHLAFHYAAHRYKRCANVHPVLLKAEDEFQLICDQKFDVFICRDVMEHLNEPLKTIKMIYEKLNDKGILIFNYIKSDADGMDTEKGVEERNAVLDFVMDHFELIDGDIDKEGTVFDAVLRKGKND